MCAVLIQKHHILIQSVVKAVDWLEQFVFN